MPKTKNKPAYRPVHESWKVVRTWLAKNLPEFETNFDKGANVKSIKALSKSLGRALPTDFSDSLRCHTSAEGIIPCPDRSRPSMCYSLMNPKEILTHWKMTVEFVDTGEFDIDHHRVKNSKGVIQQWLAPSWIPFASNGGGDTICVDLCPTYPGKLGQIIWVPHANEVRSVLAESMQAFLSQLADNYSAGNYYDNVEGIGYGISRKKLSTFPRSPITS